MILMTLEPKDRFIKLDYGDEVPLVRLICLITTKTLAKKLCKFSKAMHL